jgi:hypothetical protein
MTHPPPGPPSPPRPGGPKHDTIFALADSLGFKDLGHRGPSEPPVTPPRVAADSEGRTGGARNAPGAVPFTLPQTPPVPRFDNGPVVFFEVNVCGGLDVDQVGPAHCGSSGPHRWHDLLNP